MKTINDLYRLAKANEVKLLSTYSASFWQEYVSNNAKYDALFNRTFYSFVYFLQNDNESTQEVLDNFIADVENHLRINHKKYSELFKINVLADSEYDLLHNFSTTERMDKDTSFDKGQRSDSNSSSLGNQTVNSTNKVSPYDDENFFNDNQNTKTLGARSDSGTYVSGSQHDAGTEDYTLTKTGNVGESPATLVNKHIKTWTIFEFYNMIFNDIAKELLITSDAYGTHYETSEGVHPEGTINIITNGVKNVTNYEYANVNVPQGVFPTGTKQITSNGVSEVSNYEYVNVNVPTGGITPTGTKNITENGYSDVTEYAGVNVNVPQGVFPTGTKQITSNGESDVTEFAKVNVNVPQGVFPSGTKNITENGYSDVTNFEGVNVNVPQGVFPTGSIDITQNGTYDVTNLVSAIVNVAGGGSDFEYETGTITTVAASSEPLELFHSLSHRPNMMFMICNKSSGSATTGFIGAMNFPSFLINAGNLRIIEFGSQYSSLFRGSKVNSNVFTFTEDSVIATPTVGDYRESSTFYWFVAYVPQEGE